MKRLFALCAFLLLLNSNLVAQEGPQVPCVGCETLTHAPFPEAGLWYNPDQPGSGINLEIQNGMLAGYYYTYDANGLSQWQLFTGLLVSSGQHEAQWELVTQLQQYQDGNCTGCEYNPPSEPTLGPIIKLEFQQRNYVRLTVGDNPSQFFVPIIYGSAGMRYFEEQTPYVFPVYGNETYFVLITKPNTDPPSPWLWKSEIVPIGAGRVAGGSNERKLFYNWWIPQGPPGPDVFPTLIECELDSVSDQPGCKILLGDKEYVMPVGNMSDSRFFGEAEDGSTVEGYRLDYD